MKLHVSLIAVGIASLYFVSCTQPKSPTPEFLALKESVKLNDTRITKEVQILSEPSGARIEVNQEYVGVTPCTVEVVTNGHGKFVDKFHVTALPTQPGHYVQLKWFTSNEKAPARLFFVMNLGPSKPAINVNIVD